MLKTTADRASGGRKITFSLPAGSEDVSVVGNFNDWTPGSHTLLKRGAARSVSVVVPSDYIAVFRYLGEGGRWFDEPDASFVDAGASVLLPPTAARPVRTASSAKPAARSTAKTETAKTVPARTVASKTAPTRSATPKAAAKKGASGKAAAAETVSAKAATAKTPATKTAAAKKASKPAK